MLYLAQVTRDSISGEIKLALLACQQAEHIWATSNSEALPIGQENCLPEGLLVLAEINENRQLTEIKEAKDWIISLIGQYLSESSITPEFVQQEQARIEQWRQEIASQSLDLTRRYLEVETQREQIQELEASLKLEKEKLELRWREIQELEANLKLEKEKLELRWREIQELEANLKQEKNGVAESEYVFYCLAIAKLLNDQYFRVFGFCFHILIKQRQKNNSND